MQSQQALTQGTQAQPLVTFILTYYEQPVVMLTKCIESILALSLRPSEREIIVIDDGSATSPLNDLLRFGDAYVYLRTANGGVSTARNRGLQIANGQYIQFVDGDDMLISNVYEHCLDIARYGKADMVMFDFSHSTEADTEYNDSTPMTGSELMRTQNIQGTACCYLFKRSIIGDLRFTPGTKYGEDEEFTPLLLLRATKIVRTTAKAYYYRKHSGSAISDTTPQAVDRRLNDNLHTIKNLSTLADTLPPEERVALQRRVAQLTMDYIYNTIMLKRDARQLEVHIAKLRELGLFPLPNREYTTKYKWFRRLTNSRTGLKILLQALPLLKKER